MPTWRIKKTDMWIFVFFHVAIAKKMTSLLGWGQTASQLSDANGRGAGSVCKGSVSTGLERYRWGLGVDAH